MAGTGATVIESLVTKELRADKFGLGIAATAGDSGWAVTNKVEDKTLDCNVNDALVVGDVLGTLIDVLIAKGILTT
jgi:hypothetical protein